LRTFNEVKDLKIFINEKVVASFNSFLRTNSTNKNITPKNTKLKSSSGFSPKIHEESDKISNSSAEEAISKE